MMQKATKKLGVILNESINNQSNQVLKKTKHIDIIFLALIVILALTAMTILSINVSEKANAGSVVSSDVSTYIPTDYDVFEKQQNGNGEVLYNRAKQDEKDAATQIKDDSDEDISYNEDSVSLYEHQVVYLEDLFEPIINLDSSTVDAAMNNSSSTSGWGSGTTSGGSNSTYSYNVSYGLNSFSGGQTSQCGVSEQAGIGWKKATATARSYYYFTIQYVYPGSGANTTFNRYFYNGGSIYFSWSFTLNNWSSSDKNNGYNDYDNSSNGVRTGYTKTSSSSVQYCSAAPDSGASNGGTYSGSVTYSRDTSNRYINLQMASTAFRERRTQSLALIKSTAYAYTKAGISSISVSFRHYDNTAPSCTYGGCKSSTPYWCQDSSVSDWNRWNNAKFPAVRMIDSYVGVNVSSSYLKYMSTVTATSYSNSYTQTNSLNVAGGSGATQYGNGHYAYYYNTGVSSCGKVGWYAIDYAGYATSGEASAATVKVDNGKPTFSGITISTTSGGSAVSAPTNASKLYAKITYTDTGGIGSASGVYAVQLKSSGGYDSGIQTVSDATNKIIEINTASWGTKINGVLTVTLYDQVYNTRVNNSSIYMNKNVSYDSYNTTSNSNNSFYWFDNVAPSITNTTSNYTITKEDSVDSTYSNKPLKLTIGSIIDKVSSDSSYSNDYFTKQSSWCSSHQVISTMTFTLYMAGTSLGTINGLNCSPSKSSTSNEYKYSNVTFYLPYNIDSSKGLKVTLSMTDAAGNTSSLVTLNLPASLFIDTIAPSVTEIKYTANTANSSYTYGVSQLSITVKDCARNDTAASYYRAANSSTLANDGSGVKYVRIFGLTGFSSTSIASSYTEGMITVSGYTATKITSNNRQGIQVTYGTAHTNTGITFNITFNFDTSVYDGIAVEVEDYCGNVSSSIGGNGLGNTNVTKNSITYNGTHYVGSSNVGSLKAKGRTYYVVPNDPYKTIQYKGDHYTPQIVVFADSGCTIPLASTNGFRGSDGSYTAASTTYSFPYNRTYNNSADASTQTVYAKVYYGASGANLSIVDQTNTSRLPSFTQPVAYAISSNKYNIAASFGSDKKVVYNSKSTTNASSYSGYNVSSVCTVSCGSEGVNTYTFSVSQGAGTINNTKVSITFKKDTGTPDISLQGFLANKGDTTYKYKESDLNQSNSWKYEDKLYAVFKVSDGGAGIVYRQGSDVYNLYQTYGYQGIYPKTTNSIYTQLNTIGVAPKWEANKYYSSASSSSVSTSRPSNWDTAYVNYYTNYQIQVAKFACGGSEGTYEFKFKYTNGENKIFTTIINEKNVPESKTIQGVNACYIIVQVYNLYGQQENGILLHDLTATDSSSYAFASLGANDALGQFEKYNFNVTANTLIYYQMTTIDFLGRSKVCTSSSCADASLGGQGWLSYYVDPFKIETKLALYNVTKTLYQSRTFGESSSNITLTWLNSNGTLLSDSDRNAVLTGTYNNNSKAGWTQNCFIMIVRRSKTLSGCTSNLYYRTSTVGSNGKYDAKTDSATTISIFSSAAGIASQSNVGDYAYFGLDQGSRVLQLAVNTQSNKTSDSEFVFKTEYTDPVQGITNAYPFLIKQDNSAPYVTKVVLAKKDLSNLSEINNSTNKLLTFNVDSTGKYTIATDTTNSPAINNMVDYDSITGSGHVLWQTEKVYMYLYVTDEKSNFMGSGFNTTDSVSYANTQIIATSKPGTDSRNIKSKFIAKASGSNEYVYLITSGTNTNNTFGYDTIFGLGSNNPYVFEVVDNVGLKSQFEYGRTVTNQNSKNYLPFPVIDSYHAYVGLNSCTYDGNTKSYVSKIDGVNDRYYGNSNTLISNDDQKVNYLNGSPISSIVTLSLNIQFGQSGYKLYLRHYAADEATQVGNYYALSSESTLDYFYNSSNYNNAYIANDYDYAANGWGMYSGSNFIKGTPISSDNGSNGGAGYAGLQKPTVTSNSEGSNFDLRALNNINEYFDVLIVSNTGRYYLISIGKIFIDIIPPTLFSNMTIFGLENATNASKTTIAYSDIDTIWDGSNINSFVSGTVSAYYYIEDSASGVNQVYKSGNTSDALTKVTITGVPVWKISNGSKTYYSLRYNSTPPTISNANNYFVINGIRTNLKEPISGYTVDPATNYTANLTYYRYTVSSQSTIRVSAKDNSGNSADAQVSNEFLIDNTQVEMGVTLSKSSGTWYNDAITSKWSINYGVSGLGEIIYKETSELDSTVKTYTINIPTVARNATTGKIDIYNDVNDKHTVNLTCPTGNEGVYLKVNNSNHWIVCLTENGTYVDSNYVISDANSNNYKSLAILKKMVIKVYPNNRKTEVTMNYPKDNKKAQCQILAFGAVPEELAGSYAYINNAYRTLVITDTGYGDSPIETISDPCDNANKYRRHTYVMYKVYQDKDAPSIDSTNVSTTLNKFITEYSANTWHMIPRSLSADIQDSLSGIGNSNLALDGGGYIPNIYVTYATPTGYDIAYLSDHYTGDSYYYAYNINTNGSFKYTYQSLLYILRNTEYTITAADNAGNTATISFTPLIDTVGARVDSVTLREGSTTSAVEYNPTNKKVDWQTNRWADTPLYAFVQVTYNTTLGGFYLQSKLSGSTSISTTINYSEFTETIKYTKTDCYSWVDNSDGTTTALVCYRVSPADYYSGHIVFRAISLAEKNEFDNGATENNSKRSYIRKQLTGEEFNNNSYLTSNYEYGMVETGDDRAAIIFTSPYIYVRLSQVKSSTVFYYDTTELVKDKMQLQKNVNGALEAYGNAAIENSEGYYITVDSNKWSKDNIEIALVFSSASRWKSGCVMYYQYSTNGGSTWSTVTRIYNIGNTIHVGNTVSDGAFSAGYNTTQNSYTLYNIKYSIEDSVNNYIYRFYGETGAGKTTKYYYYGYKVGSNVLGVKIDKSQSSVGITSKVTMDTFTADAKTIQTALGSSYSSGVNYTSTSECNYTRYNTVIVRMQISGIFYSGATVYYRVLDGNTPVLYELDTISYADYLATKDGLENIYRYYYINGNGTHQQEIYVSSGAGNDSGHLNAYEKIDTTTPIIYVQSIAGTKANNWGWNNSYNLLPGDTYTPEYWYTSDVVITFGVGRISNQTTTPTYENEAPYSGYNIQYSTDNGAHWYDINSQNTKVFTISHVTGQIIDASRYTFRVISNPHLMYTSNSELADQSSSTFNVVSYVLGGTLYNNAGTTFTYAGLNTAIGSQIKGHVIANGAGDYDDGSYTYVFNVDANTYSYAYSGTVKVTSTSNDINTDKFVSINAYTSNGTYNGFNSSPTSITNGYHRGDAIKIDYTANTSGIGTNHAYFEKETIVNWNAGANTKTYCISSTNAAYESTGSVYVQFVGSSVNVYAYFIAEVEITYDGINTFFLQGESNTLQHPVASSKYRYTTGEELTLVLGYDYYLYNGTTFNFDASSHVTVNETTTVGAYYEVISLNNSYLDLRIVSGDEKQNFVVQYFKDTNNDGIFDINNNNDLGYISTNYYVINGSGVINPTPISYLASKYIQTTDLTMPNIGVIVQGEFSGEYDGDNNTITMLGGTITSDYALFNRITGKVSNIQIKTSSDIVVNTNNEIVVGLLAKEISAGTIDNIAVISNISIKGLSSTSDSVIGGLVGKVYANSVIGKTTGIYADVRITSSKNINNADISALIGYVDGNVTLQNVYSYGEVTVYGVDEYNDVNIGMLFGDVKAGITVTYIDSVEFLSVNAFKNGAAIKTVTSSSNVISTIGSVYLTAATFDTFIGHNNFSVAGLDIITTYYTTLYDDFGYSYDNDDYGEGTLSAPLIISTVDQIMTIDKYVYLDYAILVPNGSSIVTIDMSAFDSPIAINKVFTGSFKAMTQSVGISPYVQFTNFAGNLTEFNESNFGLFGAFNGTVENIVFSDIALDFTYTGTDKFYMGLVAAKSYEDAVIKNVILIGETNIDVAAGNNSRLYIGGIVGKADSSTISDIFVMNNVSVDISNGVNGSAANVGGIAGSAINLVLPDNPTGDGVIFILGRVEGIGGNIAVGQAIGTGTIDNTAGAVYLIVDNTYTNGTIINSKANGSTNDSYGMQAVEFKDDGMRQQSFKTTGANPFSSSLIFTLDGSGLYPLAGSGTETSPFLVTNSTDFSNINIALYAYYTITEDIAFNNDFRTIGEGLVFSGQIKGSGGTNISAEESNLAVISGITGPFVYYNIGAITDISLNVNASYVVGSGETFYYGAVATYNAGDIKNIVVSGQVTITSLTSDTTIYASGFVGRSIGGIIEAEISSIRNSISDLNMDIIGGGTVYVGGYSGELNASENTTFSYGIATGTITVTGANMTYAGLLIGATYRGSQWSVGSTDIEYTYDIIVDDVPVEKTKIDPYSGEEVVKDENYVGIIFEINN